MSRLVIVPEESHEAIGAELQPRLAAIAREIDANNFLGILSPQLITILESSAARSEGLFLIWATEGKGYAPAWIPEGSPPEMLSRVRAEPDEGLVARVFNSGRSEATTAEELELSEWSNLEKVLGKAVTSMGASPVHVFGNRTAVVSVVTTETTTPASLPPAEVSALLEIFLEALILRASLGLESS